MFGQIITNQDKLGNGDNFNKTHCIFNSDGSITFFSTADSLSGGDKTVTGNGGSDIWIVNMEYNHQINWQKSIGGSDHDNVFTSLKLPDGSLLLGGSSLSGVSGDKQSVNHGLYDAWLIKTDALGNVIWDKSFGGLQSDRLIDIKVTDQAIYLLCESNSGISGNKTTEHYGQMDLWLIKTDLQGNIIWQKTLGGNDLDIVGNLILHDKSIFVSSASYSPISGNKTSPLYSIVHKPDTWIVKLDTNGVILQQASFGGDYWERAPRLSVFNSKLFLSDQSSSTPGTGNKTSFYHGYFDGRVLEIDNNLNKIWEKSFGGNNYDLVYLEGFNSLGQMILVGRSNSEISGNKTVTPHGPPPGELEYRSDLWLIIYDTLEGSFVYQESIGGFEDEVPLSLNVKSDLDFTFVCTSASENTGDKTISLTPYQSMGQYTEYWIFDYTYNLGLEGELANNPLSVYPNPFTNRINVTEKFGNMDIAFYTTQGRLVLTTKSDEQGEIETSQLAKGFYLLKLTDESGNVNTTRVIKQ